MERVRYVPGQVTQIVPDKEKPGETREVIRKSEFEGVIEFDVPPYVERMKLYQQLYAAKEPGGPLLELQGWERTIKLAEMAQKHIQRVDLKHIPSGKQVTTFEAFSCYAESGQHITDIASQVLGGIQLGEPSAPTSTGGASS